MKQILKIFLLAVVLAGCSTTDEPDPAPGNNSCGINMLLFQDVAWHHPGGIFADLEFTSSGVYRENNNQEGTWAQSNGCDSLYITRPSSSNFYYRILSVSQDTLILRNPAMGDITYVQ
jgi:hypothetical protein